MSDFLKEWLKNFAFIFIASTFLLVCMGLSVGIGIYLAETYSIFVGVPYILVTVCLFFSLIQTLQEY